MKERFFEGIGRRKSSTCRVRIYEGKKANTVNGKELVEYFNGVEKVSKEALKPLQVTELEGKYYFSAVVSGGGVTGQVNAISLGLARALYEMDESLKPVLRKAGLVTRDARSVERKKYNLRKARKKKQFSKR